MELSKGTSFAHKLKYYFHSIMFQIILTLLLLLPLTSFAQWEFVAPLPTAREGLTAVVLGNKIYAIGGSNGWGFSALDIVEVYDPLLDQWVTGPPLRHPRIYAASAVHDGKIFVFGGRNGFWLVDEIEMFDPQEGHWVEVGDMYSREGLSATTYGDSIIVIGGKSSMWTYSPFANVYLPASLTWGDSLASYPMPRAGHAAVAYGDSIFIIGGIAYGILSDVSIYNGFEWVDGPELPIGLGNTGAVVVDERICVVGGNIGFDTVNKTFILGISDIVWVEADTLNTSRDLHGVVTLNNKIYAIGGGQGDYFDRDYLSSVEVLNLTNNSVHDPGITFNAAGYSMNNYPNPFSQTTNIQITSPSAVLNIEPVIIYNILGREVMRWERPIWQGSALSLRWDGKDLLGNPLPSGVYFLKVTDINNPQMQKITIVR